jgi:hypothetical protein
MFVHIPEDRGNLENAARADERTQAGSLCYIVFRIVERSLRAVPGAIAVHLL